MFTPQELRNRIAVRTKTRAGLRVKLHEKPGFVPAILPDAILMLCETLDDYLEQKLQSDKVIEGILKDINNGIDGIRAD